MLSLKQRIKEAKTEQEVWDLFLEGNSYKFVSGKTKRRWTKVAKMRVHQLAQDAVAETKIVSEKPMRRRAR